MVFIESWDLEDPKRVQIQPSYRCNLKCKFCWKTIYDDKELGEMEGNRWLEILDELCKMNIEKIIISGGGEPLIRKELISKIVKRIKDSNIKGSLVTNGTLFDEQLINKLVKIGWDEINISLHSTRNEVNDFLRGVEGTTKETLENIKKIDEIRNNKKTPKMTINVVINEYNYGHLEEFKKLSKSMNIDHVIFRLLQGEPEKCNFVPKEKLDDLTKKIKEMESSDEFNLHLAFSIDEVKNYYDR